MGSRHLRCTLVTGVLVVGLALPGTAGAPDSVKAVLDRVRQADTLVARILEAAKARDIAALRARIDEYRTVMRSVAAAVKSLPTANPGTPRALETVREATLKHMDSLKRAQEQVTSDEARAALDRALEVSQTGHNVSTAALEQVNAGTPGPPTGMPDAGAHGANAGGARGGR